jgi:hypothetical protein
MAHADAADPLDVGRRSGMASTCAMNRVADLGAALRDAAGSQPDADLARRGHWRRAVDGAAFRAGSVMCRAKSRSTSGTIFGVRCP